MRNIKLVVFKIEYRYEFILFNQHTRIKALIGYANNASGQIFIFIFLILFLFINSPFQLNKNPVCDI